MEERQARSYHRLLHRLHNSETSSASRGNRARWNRAPCTIASSSAIFLASSFPFPRSLGVDALSERPFFWRAHCMGTYVIMAMRARFVCERPFSPPLNGTGPVNMAFILPVLGGCQNCTKPDRVSIQFLRFQPVKKTNQIPSSDM